MADRGDTHYHLRTLNRWFTLSSVLFLVATFWMVINDWNRPWKRYQREFRAIEVERAEATLATEDAQAAMAEEARLQGELDAAESALANRQSEIDTAEEELRQLKATQFIATEAEKKAKQEYNWERFLFEEKELHGGGGDAELLGEKEDELYQRAGVKQIADADVLTKEEELARLHASYDEVERSLKNSTKSIDLVRKKLAQLAPEDAPTQIANVIRDFPGLDFIGPQNKVNKVVLQDLTFELNFTKKKRIDMCMTCHQAIDRAGFEEYEQPHLSHPRLDLYLSAKSPHPITEVGCTICHRGSGEALDFLRTDHRPTDEAEAANWIDEYHWHKLHYWDYPMLGSKDVEASCVQCHKDTMELIADDAPTVTEGYQLFERYGCYACHKVDWFPTKRRPGPSLRNLQQKTTKEFVDAWVAKPQAFRPTTWMPQIFHLENYEADDVIAVSEYGTGREMHGDEWSDAAVAAVSAFVWSRSGTDPAPPIPVEGNADRGREGFRLVGCLACHNMAPYEEEEVYDLALERSGTNEHGPNLRGVASKVTPEWLFAWIKDPKSYWAETRMPDLRLTDQEAADIVAYIIEDPDGMFHDVTEEWEGMEALAYDREVVEEQARWFFNRTLRSELAEKFEGEWADDQALLEAVGERWVLNQGCHSCHEISGLENAQPIGAELTTWGTKTVDKLDFGFIPDIFAEEHGWSWHEKMEFKEYRENFLVQKLLEPRSYDRRKIKNPTERLRMPWFRFSQDQAEKIRTFVIGLVEDEVQQARMEPTAEQLSMNHGLQVMRQKNCAACHLIEPGEIEFRDEDGDFHTVQGEVLAFDGEVLPPRADDFEAQVADYIAYMQEDDDEFELEEVVVQLLRPEPGVGDSGRTILVEDLDSLKVTPAWGGDFVRIVTDYYLNGLWGYDEETDEEFPLAADPDGEGLVQDVDGEWRSYADEPYAKVRWTFAPPVLTGEGDKLRRDWFYRFLNDPQPLRQQIRTRMPSFQWGEGEAAAVADYFAGQARRDWPERYARRLLVELDKSAEDVSLEIAERGLRPLAAAQIEAMVQGDQAEITANFPRLRAYGDAVGFEMSGVLNPSYDDIPQRTPSTLDPLLAAEPDFFHTVENLVRNGPNCVQCHFLRGEAPTAEGPVAWAPDLDITRERLRPDWVREWLVDPSKIYPGTAMPANFPYDQAVWQDLLAKPSAEQIEAVLTWLYNIDRASVNN